MVFNRICNKVIKLIILVIKLIWEWTHKSTTNTPHSIIPSFGETHILLKNLSHTKLDNVINNSTHVNLSSKTVAQTGVSWRTRNNMIQTNFSGVKSNNTSFRNTKSMSRVNDLLKNNKSESPETRNLKQSLTVNSNVL